ncbi:MAG: hypothetical protein Kow0037_14390 [Calditrichia bacterium]
MATYEATLLAVDVRRWDLEQNKISLTIYYLLDDEERAYMFDLSISQVAEMVEEFLGKMLMGCRNKLKKTLGLPEEEIEVAIAHETFVRQKLNNYFRRITGELNNPKRKKGQPRVIFTTHMDIYSENQDISFLPKMLQFYVVLNWARKFYEKDDFLRAIDPLRKLIKIRPDFGLGYKWLARSLKKIRKYDEAVYYYEKYAEVDGSLDSLLDLAKTYRKGKLFDKSEKIYRQILEQDPENREAQIGLAQIMYAHNDEGYWEILEKLYEQNPEWVRSWLREEFNFRIYVLPKTMMNPVQAAKYLGLEKVFQLTQMAFKNEVPSHFNPGKAKITFFKEELDNWARIMNRFQALPEEIVLYPENIKDEKLTLTNEEWDEEGEALVIPEEVPPEKVEPKIPEKPTPKVEEVLRQLGLLKDNGNRRGPGRPKKQQPAPMENRVANPAETAETQPAAPESANTAAPRRRGRPRKNEAAAPAENSAPEEQPKRRRGRPPKKAAEDSTAAAEQAPKRRGRPPKNREA